MKSCINKSSFHQKTVGIHPFGKSTCLNGTVLSNPENIIFLFFNLLIFNLLICNLNAQPTQEWVARYTGPSNDAYGPFLQVYKQGNSYVAGTHVINDSINILCVKYNTSGVQQWAALYKYPGNGYFAPSGLALDTSGNAYVISDYSQSYTLPYNGLIVKFNSLTGSPVWARTYIGQYGWSAFRLYAR